MASGGGATLNGSCTGCSATGADGASGRARNFEIDSPGSTVEIWPAGRLGSCGWSSWLRDDAYLDDGKSRPKRRSPPRPPLPPPEPRPRWRLRPPRRLKPPPPPPPRLRSPPPLPPRCSKRGRSCCCEPDCG